MEKAQKPWPKLLEKKKQVVALGVKFASGKRGSARSHWGFSFTAPVGRLERREQGCETARQEEEKSST